MSWRIHTSWSNAVVLIIIFFIATATTDIYTLSLHDALPIYQGVHAPAEQPGGVALAVDRPHLHRQTGAMRGRHEFRVDRSEEHTSELQSPMYLVCRLLLEKKKQKNNECRNCST